MNIGMIFPGYGSQFVGMGKELYDQSRVVQELFEEAANCLNQNFVRLCFASSDIELSKIDHAYPALFLLSCSLYIALEHAGIIPHIVAGYNQGEYAALFAAKSINFPDGLYLLSKYALLSQEIQTSQVLLSIEKISKELFPQIPIPWQLVADNSSDSQVICVDACDIESVQAWTDQHEGQLVKVDSGFGFHNATMVPIAQSLKMYLEKVDFKNPIIDIVSNSTGQLFSTGDDIKSQIIDQIVQPIQWADSMKKFYACTLIIEMGPESALSRWIKQEHHDTIIVPFHTLQDLDMIQHIVKKNQ